MKGQPHQKRAAGLLSDFLQGQLCIAFDIKQTLATTLTLISPPNTPIDYYEMRFQGFTESKNTIRDGGAPRHTLLRRGVKNFDTQNTFYLIVKGLKKCICHALFVVVKMSGGPLANGHPEGPASCK